jgi:hypothetical protein
MDSLSSNLRGIRERSGLLGLVRITLAIGALGIWSLAALFPFASGLLAAHPNSASDASTVSALVPQPTPAPHLFGSATFYQVLATSNKACPSGRSILVLTDYLPAYDLANYYLYPRQLSLVHSTDSFGLATLQANKGNCLLAYGDSASQRLEPFKSQLTQVTCSFDGCLYLVE